MIDLNEIFTAEAFSRQSPGFDDVNEGNDIPIYMRSRVHEEVLKVVKPGDNMLELNCGTGIDAVFFARKGLNVLATDIAEGMVAATRNKVRDNELEDSISVKKLSFSELDTLKVDTKFDIIFSNNGGLNCASDLGKVFGEFPRLLKPGGFIALDIMPPFCPWEIAHIFKFNTRIAFRRWSSKGVTAHIEGVYFHCWYYSAGMVKSALGKDFKLKKLMGLGLIAPTQAMLNFPERHPGLNKILKKIEARFSDKWPLNRWGDHYFILMRYCPR